jgi:hypothetical protein
MFSNWDSDSIGCLAYVIVGVIGIIIIIFMLRGHEEKGTLYLIGNDEPICTGTLKTSYHGYGNDTYKFTCDDGRVIQEVTNFILK